MDGASVLKGRCLPYGESVTYWPLAEMIKSAVGITDDEPLEEAFEKLRACCEDDAVADLSVWPRDCWKRSRASAARRRSPGPPVRS